MPAPARRRARPRWRFACSSSAPASSDYTTGVAARDRARQDRAVQDLIGYTQDFGAVLSSASPALPKAVVADLVKHHVVTLKGVVDAQAAKDEARAYQALRGAAAHMQAIADPLADTIARQFPQRFAAMP